jgi:hypothetical protein
MAKASAKSKAKKPRPPAKRSAASPAARVAAVTAAAASPAGSIVDQIAAQAASSPVASYKWKDRGPAPAGYIKGMAVVFARAYCKFGAGDAAVLEMAKADTERPNFDALSWYAPEFQALGLSNNAAGADTLRHLFVLLTGLGMRESSGKYCEGRDVTAPNPTAETAEAGLFQVSYDARSASPLLPPLFEFYQNNPSGFVQIFQQCPSCTAANLKNWGTGDGVEFQRLTKACPAFAAEFAAVALRNTRKHWGPINTKKAEVLRDCDTMLRGVQDLVDRSQDACTALK